MSVLMWDKPEQVLTKDQWENISFDGGPRGGFVPNMSVADARRFKAKLRYKKSAYPQVEIRWSADNGTQVLIIVGLDGWTYKNEVPGKGIPPEEQPASWNAPHPTGGYTVRMSMNQGAWFKPEDWKSLEDAVNEAKSVLEELAK